MNRKLLGFIIVVFALMSVQPVLGADNWADNDYSDREIIYINISSGYAEDEVVKINVTNNTGSQSDWRDNTFYAEDNTTELSFWLNPHTSIDGEQGIFYPNMTNLTTTSYIWRYFGNTTMTSLSDFSATFAEGCDFESGLCSPDGYTNSTSSFVDILEINGNNWMNYSDFDTGGKAIIYWDLPAYTDDMILEYEYNISDDGTIYIIEGETGQCSGSPAGVYPGTTRAESAEDYGYYAGSALYVADWVLNEIQDVQWTHYMGNTTMQLVHNGTNEISNADFRNNPTTVNDLSCLQFSGAAAGADFEMYVDNWRYYQDHPDILIGSGGYEPQTGGGDTTPPTITITNPTNDTDESSDVININVTTSENTDACLYNFDGGTNYTLSNSSMINWFTTNQTSIANGTTVQLQVYCNDTSGNMGLNDTVYFTWAVQDSNNWADTDFQYRQRLDANVSTGSESNFILYFNVTDASNKQSDFGDLRFWASDNSTELDYWIDPHHTVDGSYAKVAVEIPSVTTSSWIWMYYGNSTCDTTSNLTETFTYGCDFDGGSYCGATVTNVTDSDSDIIQIGSLNYLYYHDASASTKAIINWSLSAINYNYSLEYDYNVTTAGTLYAIEDSLDSCSSPAGIYPGTWVSGAGENYGYYDASATYVARYETSTLNNVEWIHYFNNDTMQLTHNDTYEVGNAAFREANGEVNNVSCLQFSGGSATSIDIYIDNWRIRKWRADSSVGFAEIESQGADSIAPTVTLSSPTNTSYSSSPINVNVSTNEAADWCAYLLNGSTNTTLSNDSQTNWYAELSGLSSGTTYSITSYCNDTTGNMGQSSTVYFTYDTSDSTPPELTLSSPTNSSYDGSINVNVSTNEAANWCGYKIDGSGNYTLSNDSATNWFGINSTLTYGTQEIEVYCNDSAGNMNSTSVYFYSIPTGDFVVLSWSDTHIGIDATAITKWQQALLDADGLAWNMSLALGDLSNGGNAAEFTIWNNHVTNNLSTHSGTEIFAINGNHDWNSGTLNNYNSAINSTNNYTYSVGNILFVLWGDQTTGTSGGDLEAADVAWINKTVADNQDKILFLAGHAGWYNTTCKTTETYYFQIDASSNGTWYEDIYSQGYNIDIVANGHEHDDFNSSCSSWDNLPQVTTKYGTFFVNDNHIYNNANGYYSSARFFYFVNGSKTVYVRTRYFDFGGSWEDDYSYEYEMAVAFDQQAGSDSTPPVITIEDPNNSTYTSVSIILNVSADETIDTWWYQHNSNGTNITFTPNVTITGTQGQNHIQVWANDSTGNEGTDTIYFFVDSIPPTITVNTPTNTTYDSSVSISVTTSTASACVYNIGGSNSSLSGGPTAWTGTISSGSMSNSTTYHFIAYCDDAYDNYGMNDSIWFTYEVNVGPTWYYNYTLVTTPDNYSETDTADFYVYVNINSSIYSFAYPHLYFDGEEVETGDGSYSYPYYTYSGYWTINGQLEYDLPSVTDDSEEKELFWDLRLRYTNGTYQYVNTTSFNITLYKAIINDTSPDEETMQFFIYDEGTGSLVDNVSLDITMTATVDNSTVRSYSFELNDSNNYTFWLYPGWAEYWSDVVIEYIADGYTQRSRYLYDYLLSNSSQTVNLYLLASGDSDLVKLVVKDADYNDVPNITIEIERYDVGTGNYTMITVVETDSEGKTLVYLETDTANYRFTLKDDGEVLNTYGPMVIVDDGTTPIEQIFYINPVVDEWFEIVAGLGGSCTFDSDTNISTCTGTDGTEESYIDSWCMVTSQIGILTMTEIGRNCTTGTSISLTHNFSDNSTEEYSVVLYAYTDTNQYVVDTLVVDLRGATLYGEYGIFMTFIVVLVFIIIGLAHPPSGMLFSTLGLIFSMFMGLITLSIGSVFCLFIIGSLILFKGRGK